MRTPDVSLENLARAGFAARGVVYCLVGGLALLAAIGSGGGVGGGRTALQSLLAEPFGAALPLAVGFGLACFAAWRVAEGLTDADGCGTSPKGLGVRAVHIFSGGVTGGLAVSAFALAVGLGGGGNDDRAAQDWTEWLLAKPFGFWLVMTVGAGIVIGGGTQLWKAWRGEVLKRMSVPAGRLRLAKALGRMGYAARGVTFGLAGVFLIVAALRADSSEAKGIGGALQALERQPYGWLPLGAVAIGLFAFGAFGFVQALYRRIHVPDLDDAKAAVKDTGRAAV